MPLGTDWKTLGKYAAIAGAGALTGGIGAYAGLGTLGSIGAGVGGAKVAAGGIGLAGKDPFEASQKQAGATAQRLEQSLTQAAMKRLTGRLDPATRAQIARATESSRAEQAAGQADVSRDFTRRGLRGSGLASAARQRLARSGRLERGAGTANIELASLQNAQNQAITMADRARLQEGRMRALSQQRKAQFMAMIQSGITDIGTAGAGAFGDAGGLPSTSAFAPREAAAGLRPSLRNSFDPSTFGSLAGSTGR